MGVNTFPAASDHGASPSVRESVMLADSIVGAAPGLRTISRGTLEAGTAAMCFGELPGGAGRADVMRVLEKGGSGCGLSRVQIHRLLYLVRHTAEIDWCDEGSMPIVWISVERMAHDLGVSRRRINQVERDLAEAGWISHRDAGNRHRSGERDPETGAVLNAFGVDLRALGSRFGELAAAAARRDREWAVRRAVRADSSSLRTEIKQLHAALGCLHEHDAAVGKTLNSGAPIDALEGERAALSGLRDRLRARLATPETSPQGDVLFPHIPIQRESGVTCGGNRPPLDLGTSDEPQAASEAAVEPPAAGDEAPGVAEVRRQRAADDCGVRHLHPDRVTAAGSGRFQELVGLAADGVPGWTAVWAAAEIRRRELGIHDGAWRKAVNALGRAGAAVLVVVIDARCGEKARFVWNPSGFAVACAKRAADGRLHLHRSVWGLETRRRFREAWSPWNSAGVARATRGIRP